MFSLAPYMFSPFMLPFWFVVIRRLFKFLLMVRPWCRLYMMWPWCRLYMVRPWCRLHIMYLWFGWHIIRSPRRIISPRLSMYHSSGMITTREHWNSHCQNQNDTYLFHSGLLIKVFLIIYYNIFYLKIIVIKLK